ncbi:MAG TPA: hypothetical protein H9688_03160 [Firmicutes bacterium]|nr:hypothetical protein [Bacillota bacterium]
MFDRLVSLNRQDIILAAVAALFIAGIIQMIVEYIQDRRQDEMRVGFNGFDREEAIRRCVIIFPVPVIFFNGQMFRKGTNIRITTKTQKVFQGELVGTNSSNIVCIVTEEHIIGYEIENITEIVPVDDIGQE